LKEQLRYLEALQKQDAQLQEVSAALENLPKRLSQLKTDLGMVEELLRREREAMAETEKLRKSLEDEVKSQEAQLQKARARLSQAMSKQTAYIATQREVEENRALIKEREDQILELMEKAESFRKSITTHEAEFTRLSTHVSGEEAATKKRLEELKAQQVELTQSREQLAAQVEPNLLRRYNQIRLRRGLAVVPVRDACCLGCNMHIPPQLYNQLQRANTLETCPQCHRLIYWERVLEEETPQPG
jgi:uncharacterized protein